MTQFFKNKERMYSCYTYGELISIYDLLGIKPLTRQEERAILHYVNNGDEVAAAKSVGMAPADFQQVLARDEVTQILDYFAERNQWKYEISKEAITNMFLESYHLAGNSQERVAATKELARLYDLYEEKHNDRKAKGSNTQIAIHNGNSTRIEMTPKQIEKMSTEELLLLASKHLDAIPGVKLYGHNVEPPGYDRELDI